MGGDQDPFNLSVPAEPPGKCCKAWPTLRAPLSFDDAPEQSGA